MGALGRGFRRGPGLEGGGPDKGGAFGDRARGWVRQAPRPGPAAYLGARPCGAAAAAAGRLVSARAPPPPARRPPPELPPRPRPSPPVPARWAPRSAPPAGPAPGQGRAAPTPAWRARVGSAAPGGGRGAGARRGGLCGPGTPRVGSGVPQVTPRTRPRARSGQSRGLWGTKMAEWQVRGPAKRNPHPLPWCGSWSSAGPRDRGGAFLE